VPWHNKALLYIINVRETVLFKDVCLIDDFDVTEAGKSNNGG